MLNNLSDEGIKSVKVLELIGFKKEMVGIRNSLRNCAAR